MKKTQLITITIIIIVIIAGIWYLAKNNNPGFASDDIVGCYAMRTGNDVYTLNVKTQDAGRVAGALVFKNYQKDSSSGTFTGTYANGVLLGDYAFQSEGMDSVMQVIFKKNGNTFVRGYGDVDSEGTRFIDTNTITYDSSSPLAIFTKEACLSEAQ